MIATFEDQPYRGAFSGNVVELCPVGALTSTPYRFEARPWEIQDVPTVCGMCPVGCNINATTREGKVKRILSRNHPEVDEGWLCDKGRFAYSHLYAADRVTEPMRRVGARGLEVGVVGGDRRGRAAAARRGNEHRHRALGLRERRAGLRPRQAAARRARRAHRRCARSRRTHGCSTASDAPCRQIRDADVVVVLGDEPVVERAPIVELWIRAARRKGAEILYELDEEKVRGAERAILIWSGGDGEAHLAAVAHRLGVHGAFYLPRTPNARGIAEAWAAAADAEDAENPDPVKLLVISGDEALANPDVRALAEQAENVIVISMFARPARTLATFCSCPERATSSATGRT